MFQKLKTLNASSKTSAIVSLTAIILLVLGQILFLPTAKVALADELENRSLEVMNPTPSSITQYQFSFDTPSSGTVGSILFQFCSNSSIFGDDCTAPNGFSASQATIISESGMAGFSIVPGMPDNEILLSRTAAPASPQANSYFFDNIVNTSDTGESYARISTYATTDASGTDTDDGGVAYAITNALDISAEVPQFLEFCTGIDIVGFNCAATVGDSIDFGAFTPTTTSTATSEFMAATNADSGYAVTLNGTTLTSGNNTITAANGQAAATGVDQFGLNLVANNSPSIGSDPQGPGISVANPAYSQPDRYRFSSGDTLVSANTSDDFHKFTVSYIVNVNSSQAAGDYAATMFYICLANF